MNHPVLMTQPRPATGLAARAADFGPWFHNLHFPDGSQTAPEHPLGDFPRFKWDDVAAHLPADLTGWHALDIGCNAGFYSLELARRGASVVGLDVDPHFLRQARWAREQFPFGHRIELREGQVYDLAAWDERFDLVLFMGVFYHLRYPLLALDLVAEKVKRLLVFQTLTMPGMDVLDTPEDQSFDDRTSLTAAGWPKMAFIEKRLAGDPTNWWTPNHACIEAMMRSTGLQVTARPGHEMYLCEPADAGGVRRGRAWNEDEILAATGRRDAGRQSSRSHSPP